MGSASRSSCNPGPPSVSSRAVRPATAIINAAAGPLTSAPLPQTRPMSVPRKAIPRNPPNGTKPKGHGPARKSRASAASCGSGSNGRPSGILMSPPCTKTSASGSSGPKSGGLIRRSAWRRRLAVISAAGNCARRRASSSIARASLPRRAASRINTDRASSRVLSTCAATVLMSQPVHRLGVASSAALKPSTRFAIWRRSFATAAKTNSRSTSRQAPHGPRSAYRTARCHEPHNSSGSPISAKLADGDAIS